MPNMSLVVSQNPPPASPRDCVDAPPLSRARPLTALRSKPAAMSSCSARVAGARSSNTAMMVLVMSALSFVRGRGYNSNRFFSIIPRPPRSTLFPYTTLFRSVRDHQVVIVAGETGSGKTTQLPKICLELGRGQDRLIGHTQPRRIAARSVAERIAEELETGLRSEERRVGKEGRCRGATDG